MTKVFNKFYTAVSAIFFGLIAFTLPAAAFAQAASDPFSALEGKGTELIDILQGQLAVVLLTLVIIGASGAWLMGRLKADIAIKIIVGAVIFGSAGALASWMLQK